MLEMSLLNHANCLSAVASTTSTGVPESLEIIREQECSNFLYQCRSIDEFKKVHAQFVKFGFDRDYNAGSLVMVCAFSDWGSMDYTRKLFDGISDRSTFEFNLMIRAYVNSVNNRRGSESALLLYKDMQEECLMPDNFTFPFLLKSCAQLSTAKLGRQVHGQLYKFGCQTDSYVQNSLVNMYGKCREIRDSCSVFQQMRVSRDVASWSAILAAHTKVGHWGKCLKHFEEMCAGGWETDESSLVSVLVSCAHLGALDMGMCIHCSLLRRVNKPSVITQTALIDMYTNCGHLSKGIRIFRNMSFKNKWTYSVMISGLAMHGEGEKALQLFSDMLVEGLVPDETVYVGVLTACSHAGLLAEGMRCFDKMRLEHHIEPTIQHYCCMVALMSRSGELQKAYELIKTMPMEPNEYVWRSLLNGCRIHKNLEFTEFVGKKLLKLNRYTAGDYVLLSNIYTQVQRWDEAASLRTEMVKKGLSQVPGFSTIEVKKEVHTFASQDKSHPWSKEIYEMLYQMEWQLRFEGYCPDTSQVFLCVDEEEKKRVLSGHSQKLAIAYGLISTRRGKVLRISRNFRMCSDCHTYTKLISKIFEREIVVRDRNHFHCFREGTCSCRDYW